MSSISSATTQQQFIQVQQNAAKTDAVKGGASSNADTQQAQTAQTAQTQNTPTQSVKPATGGSNSGLPESKYFRNSDGTFGPNHTVLPPYNPSKPTANDSTATQTPDSTDVGVNVKI